MEVYKKIVFDKRKRKTCIFLFI